MGRTMVKWQNTEELSRLMDDAIKKSENKRTMYVEEEIDYDAEYGYFDYYDE